MPRSSRRSATSVLTPDGGLDRPGLGALVFADAAARSRLNDIVHPEVRRLSAEREAKSAAADPATVIVHDIPLLVETGQAEPLPPLVVCTRPPSSGYAGSSRGAG